jgi:TusA-related sulfurtransferase
VRPTKVVLLPEERIFTVPAGQEIKVMLDKEEMTMTFPYDMKLTSPTVLVRQEEKLNNALLDKVKANADKKTAVAVVGSVLGIIAAGLGIFFKAKSWFPSKVTATIETKK